MSSCDVRSLATTVLFDIHDQIKGLPGATEARRISVAKALQYLDSLSQQSQGDIALQSELAAAYERSGSILGNVADSAVDGAQSSLPQYRKALELRRQVASQKPADMSSRRSLARAHELVGVGHLGLGQPTEAMTNFESAMRIFGTNPLFQAEMLDRMGSAHSMLGQYDRAIQFCQQALALIQAQPANSSPDLDKLTARIVRLNGMLLRLAGRNAEAIPLLRKSADLLVKLMAKYPDEMPYRRSYAMMLPTLARAYENTGQREESDRVWTEARNRLTPMAESSVDPQIVLSLGYALKHISENHHRDYLAGVGVETGEAELALAQGYAGRLAVRPKAGVVELAEYAELLVKYPYPKLQNYKQGLVFALRANELSNFRLAMVLDTLAWAYFRTGDKKNAIKTMERALGLLPLTPGSANDRKEYADALREFKEDQAAK